MTPPQDELERRLSEALAARAAGVEPTDEQNSLDRIERRITEERRTTSSRRRLLIGLGAAAALIVIVGAVVLLRDDGKQDVNVVPAASSTTATTATTTTTTATTLPAPVEPHIWPYESSTARFTTPADAARSFAVDFLGMSNARVGQTTGDSAAATVEIFPNARANARTVVSVVQHATLGWIVVGANADQIVVDEPRPHDPITSPITVSGQSTAFEAQLGLELRQLGSKTAVATGTAMGGSNGEIGPFSTTIDPPSTDQPLVLLVFEGDASGEQTYTKATVVLLGT